MPADWPLPVHVLLSCAELELDAAIQRHQQVQRPVSAQPAARGNISASEARTQAAKHRRMLDMHTRAAATAAAQVKLAMIADGQVEREFDNSSLEPTLNGAAVDQQQQDWMVRYHWVCAAVAELQQRHAVASSHLQQCMAHLQALEQGPAAVTVQLHHSCRGDSVVTKAGILGKLEALKLFDVLHAAPQQLAEGNAQHTLDRLQPQLLGPTLPPDTPAHRQALKLLQVSHAGAACNKCCPHMQCV